MEDKIVKKKKKNNTAQTSQSSAETASLLSGEVNLAACGIKSYILYSIYTLKSKK